MFLAREILKIKSMEKQMKRLEVAFSHLTIKKLKSKIIQRKKIENLLIVDDTGA